MSVVVVTLRAVAHGRRADPRGRVYRAMARVYARGATTPSAAP
jgi:hypothetical protein